MGAERQSVVLRQVARRMLIVPLLLVLLQQRATSTGIVVEPGQLQNMCRVVYKLLQRMFEIH